MKNIRLNTGKAFILEHMGSIAQLCGVKQYTLSEGRANGVRAVDIATGTGLDYTVLLDRCMDIACARYKGVPIAYLSKAEIAAPSFFEQDGMEWLRSFYAGLLTTCGVSNAGAPCRIERRIFGEQFHGLHGRFSHIPAYDVCASGDWTGGQYQMTVSGKMRQSAVHGENIELRRTITSLLGERTIRISDAIENEGHTSEPFMLLYHMNFGFPLFSENSRLVLAARTTQPASILAEAELDRYDRFDEPSHLYDERCYFHTLLKDDSGETSVLLINDELEFGVELRFPCEALPCFTEWKMQAQGEYVLGLEPGNVFPIGRVKAEAQGALPYLEPGSIVKTQIDVRILDGSEEIGSAQERIAELKAHGR